MGEGVAPGAGASGVPAGVTRILCHGVTGSGKTTLARAIAARTGLPFHSADDEVGWLPGWVERPVPEQRAIAAELAAADEWVLDTAYGRWRDLVAARAQLIVALDLPRWVSLGRLLRRTARRIRTAEAVCNGNRETLRLALSRESIVAWHFRSFAKKRRQIDEWEADPSAPPVVRLRSAGEVARWLDSLDSPPVSGGAR